MVSFNVKLLDFYQNISKEENPEVWERRYGDIRKNEWIVF